MARSLTGPKVADLGDPVIAGYARGRVIINSPWSYSVRTVYVPKHPTRQLVNRAKTLFYFLRSPNFTQQTRQALLHKAYLRGAVLWQ